MSLVVDQLPQRQTIYVRDSQGIVYRSHSPFFGAVSRLMRQTQVILVAYQMLDRRGRFFEEEVQLRCLSLGIRPDVVSRTINALVREGYFTEEGEAGHYSLDRERVKAELPAFEMQAGGNWFRNQLLQSVEQHQ